MTQERDQHEAWAVEVWNACCPAGTPVVVTLDDGSTEQTATRSRAWRLGNGTPVVSVEGRAGGYLLWRVLPTAWRSARKPRPEPTGPLCTCPDAVPCPVHDDEIGTGEVDAIDCTGPPCGDCEAEDDCPF
jgi:hypothetical protein